MFIVWLLPLHGFSGIRQVHLNAVFIFVCLQTHPLKHPRFPQISVNCVRKKWRDVKLLCFQSLGSYKQNRQLMITTQTLFILNTIK